MPFFLSCLQELDRSFKGLFNQSGNGEGNQSGRGQQASDRFMRIHGWQYTAHLIAEFERITLDQAYDLPIIQALNDMSYLKAKGRMEAEVGSSNRR